MKDQNKKRNVFWESDLADIQKTYLPEGTLVTDLPFAEIDWRVPPRGCPLIAMGRIDRLPKDELERGVKK